MEQELRFGLDLGKIFFKNIVDGENIFGIEWSWFFKKNFAHENMKKTASKVAHNRPKCFFSVMPTGPNPVQISIPVP